MTRKGVYPYEYMDSRVKFDESELPSKKSFDSTLTGQAISDVDYEHAKNVFDVFENAGLERLSQLLSLDRRSTLSRCIRIVQKYLC